MARSPRCGGLACQVGLDFALIDYLFGISICVMSDFDGDGTNFEFTSSS